MMRLPLAIFLLLSGIYLLTMSGHTYSADEETMLAVTRGMLARGDVAVVADGDAPLAALRPGRDGGRYSPYGVLPSLLAMPFQLIGGLLGDDAGQWDYASRFAVTALNGFVTAGSAALLAAWAMRLGAMPGWAATLALLYGFATFAWPYARTFFSEPLAGLLLLLAAERADAAARELRRAPSALRATGERAGGEAAPASGPWPSIPARARRALFICGLACGLLLTTRIAAAIALPVIGLFLLWACWRAAPGSTVQRLQFVARCVVPAAAGLLPGLGLLLWYNSARFGTPLASGYASEAALFTTPLLEGLRGLLLSPGKSVVLYAPPLLLAIPGGVALWRRGERGVVLLACGLFLSHVLLYARWGEWQGGGVWGPRFLLPVVAPLLVLAAGAGGAPGKRSGARGAALLLGTLGLVGNLGGVLLHPGTYVVAPAPADKLSSIAGSPLIGHWRMLAERWTRATAPAPVCRLGDGLYPSEDTAGAALPRRTGAVGRLRCALSAPASVSFTLDDRRPPGAQPSNLRLRVGTRDLGAPPAGQLRAYRLLLPPGTARLEIQADTWNPRAVGFSERDDELGPLLGALRGTTRTGAPVAVIDTAVAPLPTRPRPRWAWYYDPPNQHLADHWAWHLPRSELAGPRAPALASIVVMTSVALLAAGTHLLRRTPGPHH
ncbi:MAG: hypothetical protein OHK0015_38280 [Chloroflexi bacterium OHK40]